MRRQLVSLFALTATVLVLAGPPARAEGIRIEGENRIADAGACASDGEVMQVYGGGARYGGSLFFPEHGCWAMFDADVPDDTQLSLRLYAPGGGCGAFDVERLADNSAWTHVGTTAPACGGGWTVRHVGAVPSGSYPIRITFLVTSGAEWENTELDFLWFGGVPRAERRSYTGGSPGTVLCGPGIGGACFSVQGETIADVIVTDSLSPVGGYFEVRDAGGRATGSGFFCQHRLAIGVAGGSTQLIVWVGGAFGPVGCLLNHGQSLGGAVTAILYP